MATAYEQVESRSTGKDRAGKKIGSRRFRVDVPPDAAIALSPTGLPVPGFDTYPGDTSLVCDSLRASPLLAYDSSGGPQSWVDADYTTDGSGHFGGGINPTDPNFRSWAVDYRTEDLELPYWLRDPAAYSYTDPTAPAGQQEKLIQGYEVRKHPFKQVYTVIVRRTVITVFDSAQIDLIASQANSLHLIGARWYLYVAGQVEEIDKNRWTTSHTWVYDPGTPNALPFPANSPSKAFPIGLVCQNSGMYPGVLFRRPPFHKIIVDPGPIDPGPPPVFGPPVFTAAPLYDNPLPTGWQFLPGMP